MISSSSLVFAAERSKPEIIVPAQPTPYETKNLSDIDDQKGFRFNIPVILFFKNVVGMKGSDPVKVIREAIAKALVYYYPLAGRLREGPNRKLMVECTNEGVIFIEANARVRLEQFGDIIQPPFPCLDDLLYNVPGSDGVLNCPLLLIQVTRLMCGGFIFALRLNHAMSDAPGLIQFLTAVTEMASGALVPSTQPMWKRELLCARDPPRLSSVHHFYREVRPSKEPPRTDDHESPLVLGSFLFGPQEIAVLRNQVAPHLGKCTRFELLTACMWRYRTSSLGLDPDDEVRLACIINARTKYNPPLPVGFYGNAFGLPVAVSTAGELCQNPLGYAVELVRKAKEQVTDEFMRSLADLLVQNGRPYYVSERTYIVSDVTRLGFHDIDFGWGKPMYRGPVGTVPAIASFFVALKSNKGEDGIVVTMNLPGPAMDIFVRELEKMMKGPSFRLSSM